VPREVYLPRLRLPVELSGPASASWRFPEKIDNTRPVVLKVYSRREWREINDAKGVDEVPDPKAQERWIRENVRLFVNTSHLDPAVPEEQDAPIHARTLPRDPFLKYDIEIEVKEGTTIPVLRRPEAKKDGG
jgi:hypothetical protein